MKILEIIKEEKNRRLTKTQEEVLTLVFVSPTPYVANDKTTGSINLHSARDSLISWGYLMSDENGVVLTDKGKNALQAAGIIDGNELTDYGRNLFDKIESDI